MTDIIDRANAEADRALQEALRKQQRRMPSVPAGADWHTASAEICEGDACGEPIPETRRRLLPGVRLCVDCQARLERGYGR